MRILIAEDDCVSRCLQKHTLSGWGYEVIVATNGRDALDLLLDQKPEMAVIDWMMPGLDGIEVVREVRKNATPEWTPYLLLLTVKTEKPDVVAGLNAGADDYLTKPFNIDEFRARIAAGARIVGLQKDLIGRLKELEVALANVKQLQGLLPICSYCKNVRDDSNYWQRVEQYLTEHTDVRLSHGICPPCYENTVKPSLEAFLNK